MIMRSLRGTAAESVKGFSVVAENYEPVRFINPPGNIWIFKIDFGCPHEGFDPFTKFDF